MIKKAVPSYFFHSSSCFSFLKLFFSLPVLWVIINTTKCVCLVYNVLVFLLLQLWHLLPFCCLQSILSSFTPVTRWFCASCCDVALQIVAIYLVFVSRCCLAQHGHFVVVVFLALDVLFSCWFSALHNKYALCK